MSSIGICDICKHKEVDIKGTPCRFCMARRGEFEIDLAEHDKQIRAEVIDEIYNKIDEGVCDICEHKDFESDCFKTCNFEIDNAKKWLLGLKEQK